MASTQSKQSKQSNTSKSAVATIDHERIRTWVDERGGCPARVKGTERGDDPGLLRIDFPGYSGEETLECITWDEWFRAFDNHGLSFLYEPEPQSRFNKLIRREG
ncbi:MAG TPA: hypothetical protein VGQ62_22075 [Chloroflexota bacterium]|nr:hypothetical protein [Chloroflexota bacterium]